MLKSELTGAAMNALRGQTPIGDFSSIVTTQGNPIQNSKQMQIQVLVYAYGFQTVFSNGSRYTNRTPLQINFPAMAGGAGGNLQSLASNIGGMTGT